MKHLIYADNAATTQMDVDVFEAMKPYLLHEYGNASQPYSFARQPKKAIQEARETIASCIGALPEEIYFTSGGTESDNWAIKGIAFRNYDHRATITTAFEHHAVLHACEASRIESCLQIILRILIAGRRQYFINSLGFTSEAVRTLGNSSFKYAVAILFTASV